VTDAHEAAARSGGQTATRFVLTSLAVWRITRLLAEEDGPADMVLRLRARLGEGPLGELMDCFYCLSIWVAAPASLAVVRRRREVPLVWLALSGAACLLEQATAERRSIGANLAPHEAEAFPLPEAPQLAPTARP
jgi:hypothetical protein